MQITQLCSSRSIGIVEYTRRVASMLHDKSLACNVVNIGGQHTLMPIKNDQLVDHIISRLSGYDGVLHIQYDTLLFRGVNGDDYDEFENFVRFLQHAESQFKTIVVTMHGQIYFPRSSSMLQSFAGWLLQRYYKNKVVPLLNRSNVLVHSESHLKLLRTYGVTRAQQWLLPLRQSHDIDFESPDVNNLKLVMPGKLSSWKNWQLCVCIASKVPGCTLTVSNDNSHTYEQIVKFAEQHETQICSIQWSPDPVEYEKQLQQFDLSVLAYSQDIPYSGCLNSSIELGVLVACIPTQSFNQIQAEHDCLITGGSADDVAENILKVFSDIKEYRRRRLHMQNYVDFTSQMSDRLVRIYTSEPPGPEKSVPDRGLSINCKPVTHQSKTVNLVHPAHKEFCKMLPSIVQKHPNLIAHVEHHLKHGGELWPGWTGVLHGGFDSRDIPRNDLLPTSVVTDNHVDSRCDKLYVTNTVLKELVQPYVECPVELLDLRKYIKQDCQFSMDEYLSGRCITQVGWLNSQPEAIFKLKTHINKCYLVSRGNDVSRELLQGVDDYYLNRDVIVVADIPAGSVLLLYQNNDDVVENYILYMLRTGTPGLVRRDATTQEYLGEDYVLMFDDIKTAGDLLTDDNIKQAHEQLTVHMNSCIVRDFEFVHM